MGMLASMNIEKYCLPNESNKNVNQQNMISMF